MDLPVRSSVPLPERVHSADEPAAFGRCTLRKVTMDAPAQSGVRVALLPPALLLALLLALLPPALLPPALLPSEAASSKERR